MGLAMIPREEQLSVRQASELSGYSARAVTRWIEAGAKLRSGGRLKLRAERYPSGWRTTERWLCEFVEALTRDRTGHGSVSDESKARAAQANAVLAASGW